MKGLRRARAAEQIRRDLSDLLEFEVDDPSIPAVRLTAVELAPDYSYAKVMVVPSELEQSAVDNEDQFLAPLRRASGYLRSLLADRLDIRRVPTLDFRLDRGAQNASRVEDLLHRIAKRRKDSDPLAAILLVLGLLSAAAPLHADEKPEWERYEASASVMGSEMRIALYGPRKGTLASATVAAFEEARRIDRLISNYRPDSEWSRLNDEAGRGPVQVSQESVDLLTACIEYSRLSEGAFDVTVGRLVDAWGFFRGSGALPGGLRMQRALAATGYNHLKIDRSDNTVRFAVPNLALDPGGIGKGYAVERIAELLHRYGVKSALISAGTSTLYAIGAPPDQPEGWKVEIREPRRPDRRRRHPPARLLIVHLGLL
jgi:ribosome-binding factor A